MKLDDLRFKLETAAKIPIDSVANERERRLPFGQLYDIEETHGSDDRIFYKTHDVTLEIYTEHQNAPEVGQLAACLTDLNIPYSLSRAYIHNERIFNHTFDFNFIEKTEE